MNDIPDRPGPEGPDFPPRHASPTGNRYDLLILQTLRRITRHLDLHSKRLRSTHEITGPQLVCLTMIVQDGPTSIKRLAENVSLSASTVVGVLDRLESKGLIMRLRDLRDRRVVNVSATPTGFALVGRGPSPLHEGLAAALKELPEIEQATIALSLRRIVDLMETPASPDAPHEITGTPIDRGEDD